MIGGRLFTSHGQCTDRIPAVEVWLDKSEHCELYPADRVVEMSLGSLAEAYIKLDGTDFEANCCFPSNSVFNTEIT